MMQLPSLSNFLGLAKAQPQPGGAEAGAAGDIFAQLLAGAPGQPQGEGAGSVPQALSIATGPKPVDPAMQAALQAELGTMLASPAAGPQRPSGKMLAEPGKTLADPGKALPVAQPAADIALVALFPVTPSDPAEPAAEAAKADSAPAPLGFADLALLQGWGPPISQLSPAAVKAEAPKPGLPHPPQPQLAANAALALPLANPAARDSKPREGQPGQAASPASFSVSPPSAPVAAAATVNIPLVRAPATRQSALPRAPEPIALAPSAPQLAEPQAVMPEGNAAAPAAEPPAAPELGTIIDRLVETRIQSREGRSEIALPHPDFGRVTLEISLAGADQLSVAMPDAPAELRVAVGQAFASPPRSDTAPLSPSADNAFASGTSSQDPRRDPQGRGGEPRANTEGQQTREFTTTRDNRRQASGRGVLA